MPSPFFYDLSANKEKKGETQPQSDGAGEHGVLIALIANNMFLRVARQRRLLGGEKGAAVAVAAAGSSSARMSCFQPDHLCLSAPLRRGEEAELLGHSDEREEMGQRSTLTQFAIPLPRPRTLNEARIIRYISEVLI